MAGTNNSSGNTTSLFEVRARRFNPRTDLIFRGPLLKYCSTIMLYDLTICKDLPTILDVEYGRGCFGIEFSRIQQRSQKCKGVCRPPCL
jgi:hypothetical protein